MVDWKWETEKEKIEAAKKIPKRAESKTAA